MKNSVGRRSRFRHERKRAASRFHRGSFRTIASGSHRVVVGCPKDHGHKWISAGGRSRCIGGMRAASVLHPRHNSHRRNISGRGVSGMAKRKKKSGIRRRKTARKSRGRKSSGAQRRHRPVFYGRRVSRRSKLLPKHRGQIVNRRRSRRNPRRRRNIHRMYRRNPNGGFWRIAGQFGLGVVVGGLPFAGLIAIEQRTKLGEQRPWVQGLVEIGTGAATAGLLALIPAARRRPVFLLGAAAPGLVVGLWDIAANFIPALGGGPQVPPVPAPTGTGNLPVNGVAPGTRAVGADGRVYEAVEVGMGNFARSISQGSPAGGVSPGTRAVGADGRVYEAVSVSGFSRSLSGPSAPGEPIMYEALSGFRPPSDVQVGGAAMRDLPKLIEAA